MKNVVLISLYSDNAKAIPPLGLLYLATALNKGGYQAKIIHKRAAEVDDIIKEVEGYEPILVGMSVFTGYFNLEYIKLSKELKNLGFKIVWGNAHASLVPEKVLKQDYIDYIILGEGEKTLVELVQNIEGRNEYDKILGLGYKDQNGEIKINAKRDFINLDDYLIDWSLVDLEKYLFPYFSDKYQRVMVVTTSRGCPFNCQFCYNLVFNNRRWRAHSADKIIENLKPVIEKYRIDAIRFIDDNFFVDKSRAFKITEALGLPYLAESRVEYINEEFVENLKKTNCQEIILGLNPVRKGYSGMWSKKEVPKKK
jgi:anaerobic magnesium-protoporphyrin IX monomethyl ester cyclase